MITNAQFNRLFWWLFAMAALLLFFRIGAAPIYILDEAKNAQCAAEMWASKQWLIPTFNGELRTDKPPLHYWFMAISYSLFGMGEWQARLFSAFAGLGTIFLSFYFVKRYLHTGAAFFTALVLVLSTHFLFEFRLAVPDPFLILFTTGGLFSGFSYVMNKSLKWLLVSAAALALATLAKGPVALALPGICLLLLVILKRQFWVFKDLRLLWAAALYLLIAGPWFLVVHFATEGGFTEGFFLDHNLNRFSSEMEGHGGPFFITILFVLVGLLPFTPNVVQVVKRCWKFPISPIVLFGAIVSVVYVLFFSISSTKLPNYPIPCYPFAAIVIGFVIWETVQQKSTWPTFTWYILLMVGLALPIVGFFALQTEGPTKELAPLAWGLLIWPLSVICCIFLRKQGFYKQLQWLALGLFLFNAFFLGVAYPLVYQQNPITQLKPTLQQPNTVLVAYKDFNAALNFNVFPPDQFLLVCTSVPQLKAEIAKANKRRQQIIIISRVDKLPELEGMDLQELAKRRDLFEIPTTILLSPKNDFKN